MIIKVKNSAELNTWLNVRRRLSHNFESIKGPAPEGAQDDDGALIDWPINHFWKDTTTGECFKLEYGPVDAVPSFNHFERLRQHIGKASFSSSSDKFSALECLEALRVDGNQPNLGLATTAQLIEELAARARLGGYADYKTVGGS